MPRQIAAIALKEFSILIKDLEALALLFAMPVFFILIMSFALEGVFEAGTADHPMEILVVNEDAGRMAGVLTQDIASIEGIKITQKIDGAPLTRDVAERLVKERSWPAALLFKTGFSESVQEYARSVETDVPAISLIMDPATSRQLLAPVQAAVTAMVERRVMTARRIHQLQERFSEFGLDFSKYLDEEEDSTDGLQTRGVSLEILAPEGAKAVVRPSATEQNVPAYTIFGVFFIVLPLAAGFMREKNDGTFQRILAAPVSRATLLVGKLLPYYLVNLIQIGLMFTVGVVLFGIQTGNLPGLILVSLSLAACANGLGLMVAALGRTEAQIGALGVFFAVILSALGGMMVPTFVMPEVMETLSRCTPHAWALSGYHDLMLRGLGFADVLKETLVLFGFAAFFFLVALWRFRFAD